MNKIPKIIHYCWFGGNPLPEEIQEYIKTWKKYCPDYEIKEWNESNFDINICPYVKEAYESKKWAFVSDYARIYAMYNYGGIYLDTDVELLKNFDNIIKKGSFFALTKDLFIATAVMGFEKKDKLLKQILDLYATKHFVIKGKMDITTNVELITNLLKEKDDIKIFEDKYQIIDDYIFYPSIYFHPELDKVSKKTYAIHHMNASWITEYEKSMTILRNKYKKVFGNKLGNEIFNVVTLIPRSYHFIKDYGLKYLVNRIINKFKR